MKRIKGFEKYAISKMGFVYRVDKKKKIKGTRNKKGYLNVTLYNYGNQIKERKVFYVHRLVMLHYRVNEKNKPCINHVDEDKENNAVSNLEWCTYKENNNHGSFIGKMRNSSSKKVIQKNLKGVFVKEWFSATVASIKLKISQAEIPKCCLGQKVSYKGFYWEFKKQNNE